MKSSGHSGKVGKLLLLRSGESDEGERDARTESWSFRRLSCLQSPFQCFFRLRFDTYFIICSPSASGKTVQTSLRLLSNLLFPLRLQVRRSEESPLVVFAISIATPMSSIHFCISATELGSKSGQSGVNKTYQTTPSSAKGRNTTATKLTSVLEFLTKMRKLIVRDCS